MPESRSLQQTLRTRRGVSGGAYDAERTPAVAGARKLRRAAGRGLSPW